jgi:iron(III) transport system permease protein
MAEIAVAIRQRTDPADRVGHAGLLLVALLLLVFLAAPLATVLLQSFEDRNRAFVGLENFVVYLHTPALTQSLWNSVWVAGFVTLVTVPAAFLFAYALTRSRMPLKGVFRTIALTPLLAPSLLAAISFIYWFGNQGVLKGIFFASIYGAPGIIVSQIFAVFPHALMILITALALADARLYEAADALGTSMSRKFFTITLPGAKYGLISAALVTFTLVITDFGIPKVIGGQFNVLATDAYKQVVGQQNFSMGAVVGMILLVPAVLAFVIDRMVQRRQFSLLSARAVPYEPKPNRVRDMVLTAYVAVIAAVIIGLLAVAVWASFITYWPYNLSLTLRNYNFGTFDADGWTPYFNSLKMALMAAVIGTAVVFTGAYLIDKTKISPGGRAIAHLLAMLPMAVPGLVLGLGYVFFFNAPWNPFNILYGTLLVLVINCTAHFYTVAHITALTALKQIDPEFESVASSLKVPTWHTFRRVTVPICMPAIFDIAVYMFVNALTTVSAVIFLYGPGTKLASVAIVHMDEAGVTAGAAAMATLIVATALSAKVLHVLADKLLLIRLQAWRKR